MGEILETPIKCVIPICPIGKHCSRKPNLRPRWCRREFSSPIGLTLSQKELTRGHSEMPVMLRLGAGVGHSSDVRIKANVLVS